MDTIHLCIAADKNYKLPLKALVNSVYKNSSSHKCVIHVLFTGLSQKYRKRLIDKYLNSNLSFDFVDMSKYEFDFHGLDMQYWTKAIFYRIMIPEIFKDLKRILYIDGDTLVIRDLYEFFNMEIPDNKMLAMVLDKFSWDKRMKVLNTSCYYNSGVILFDIQKCIAEDFSQKCIQWLYNNSDIAIYPDQDAINVVCNNKILPLSNLYNKMIEPRHYVVIEQRPFILHFLSEVKPWMWKYSSKFDLLYLPYIPTKFIRTRIRIEHFIMDVKNFCFHTKHSMILDKSNVLDQCKYYIFNMCVYTKNIAKYNFIEIFKQKKLEETTCS